MAKKTAKKTAKKAVKRTPAVPVLFGAKLKLSGDGEFQTWQGTVGKAEVEVTEDKSTKLASCKVNLDDADGNPVLYCENEAETAQKACNLCKVEILKAYKGLSAIVNS